MQRFERNFRLKSVKAMQDLTLERNLKKTSQSVLDIYFILFILTNCNRNCFTTVKYWENMALFSKTFQSFPFGDQQFTEPLIFRHINESLVSILTRLS